MMSPVTRSSSRHRHTTEGQAMVEFSLIAFLFFFTLFAVIQFGITFMQHSAFVFAVRDAARQAAIYASVGIDPNPPAGVVNTNVASHYGDNKVCRSLVASIKSAALRPENLESVSIYDASHPELREDGTCTFSKGEWVYQEFLTPATISINGVSTATKPWLPCARNATDGSNDQIAVVARLHYSFIIPIFGGGLTFDSSNAQLIEPTASAGTTFAPVAACPTVWPGQAGGIPVSFP